MRLMVSASMCHKDAPYSATECTIPTYPLHPPFGLPEIEHKVAHTGRHLLQSRSESDEMHRESPPV